MTLQEITDLIVAVEKYDVYAPSAASLGGLDRDDAAEFLFDCFDPEGAKESPNGENIWDDMSDAYQAKYFAIVDEMASHAKPATNGSGTPDAFLKNTALKALRSLEAVLEVCDKTEEFGEVRRGHIRHAISTAWGSDD